MLQFTASDLIPAPKEKVYNAWLDGNEHGKMTGAHATSCTKVGDSFTAHGDYISGKNEELVPYTKIVQSWRTTEFSDDEEDSVLEVIFEDKNYNTLITLIHSNLPPHGAQYEQGWKDFYFKPMIAYFSKSK